MIVIQNILVSMPRILSLTGQKAQVCLSPASSRLRTGIQLFPLCNTHTSLYYDKHNSITNSYGSYSGVFVFQIYRNRLSARIDTRKIPILCFILNFLTLNCVIVFFANSKKHIITRIKR